MLLPGQTDHYAEPVLPREVKEPARWRSVCSDRVEAVGRNSSEVFGDHFRIAVLIPIRIRAKWAICDSPDVELIAAGIDKLSTHTWSLGGGAGELRLLRADG